VLNVSLAAHDIVAHSYGTESREADDAIRRLDLQIGRILAALEEKFALGETLVALSADHGFSPIPEVQPRVGETRTGGRLVTSDRALPAFQVRLARMLAASLCLDPATSKVLATDTSWNFAWAAAFPQRTIEGSCGRAGREVSRAEMSQAAKRLILNHFAEEVEEVLLVDEQAGWPRSKAAEMARNVLDFERIGDILLIPRPHALVHWDAARGSGHGSHHDYDTHVPLIFMGAGFARGTSSDPVTPYDLAPTLGAAVGIKLPQATGRSLLGTPR
jgi:arylsulfatase A-like enzyme